MPTVITDVVPLELESPRSGAQDGTWETLSNMPATTHHASAWRRWTVRAIAFLAPWILSAAMAAVVRA